MAETQAHQQTENKTFEIRPQDGFQVDFLSSPADIVIGGGAAGAGKTFAELLEPLRHVNNPNFGAIFFRRTSPQITAQGGLLDESTKIYYELGAKLNKTSLMWTFPSGATVKFRSLEHEKNVYDHQGAQYPLIIFDELTHFRRREFFYLLSRNRSTCGVNPYVRATCNPDPESWVAELISWWIDEKTGYPIKERAGVLRYFIVEKGNYIFGDSKKEVVDKVPYLFEDVAIDGVNELDLVKSITFIPGSVYQNRKLLDQDPEYLANLLSQDETERARLLQGNWKLSPDGMSLFDFSAVMDVFSNTPPENQTRCITCDAARFGANLAVIMVWNGYEVVQTHVYNKSALNVLFDVIERERKIYNIPKSNVLVDQDGLGGGLVDFGEYRGFSGGEQAFKGEGISARENFVNKKTQLYYKLAHFVNSNRLNINLTSETCKVNGIGGTKVKVGEKNYEVKELIKRHLRCIRKKITDGDGKLRINSKEEQKAILGGDESPDFADTLMMRMQFEYKGATAINDLQGIFY